MSWNRPRRSLVEKWKDITQCFCGEKALYRVGMRGFCAIHRPLADTTQAKASARVHAWREEAIRESLKRDKLGK